MNPQNHQGVATARAREAMPSEVNYSIDRPYDSFAELKYRSPENLATAKMARGIGYFSIALGLAEIFMPARVGEMAGIRRSHRMFLPLLGAREVAHGISILKGGDPTTGVWLRVPGDALDLAYLGASFASDDGNKGRLGIAAVAVLGVAALDVLCAKKLSSSEWVYEQGANLKDRSDAYAEIYADLFGKDRERRDRSVVHRYP